MISSWGIRKYLLRQPRPAKVRMTVRGVAQEMAIGRGQSLSKVADSIHAVAPDIIELFDSDGGLIRAMRPETEVDPVGEQPKVPAPLTADPETARLTHFAALLARSYEFSVGIAFNKLVEIVERIDARMEGLETRLERTETAYRRTLHQQLLDAQEEALDVIERASESEEPEGNDLVNKMVGAFLGGQARGRANRKTKSSVADSSGPTNGSNGKA